MQTLHLRANEQVMQKILASINTLAKDGNDIEILDNQTLEKERAMINTALEQIKQGETYSHEEVWEELLS